VPVVRPCNVRCLLGRPARASGDPADATAMQTMCCRGGYAAGCARSATAWRLGSAETLRCPITTDARALSTAIAMILGVITL
jgi:hypothetical protein